jgi:dihydroorotate dehydrogenase (NAD+) catalytic subunit
MADLAVRAGGLALKNPVIAASGIVGYGTEYAGLMDYARLGGFVTKGLSPRPRTGHAPPRIAETAAGMLNAIGLENVGVEAFVREKVPAIATLDTRCIANVFGTSVAEYVEVCAALDGVARVEAFEINLSCPHVEAGGAVFGRDPRAVREVTAACKRATRKPVWIKLTPNVTDPAEIARAAEDAGADAVSLINSVSAMAIDVRTRRPLLSHGTGGLTGPAIKPIAIRQVFEVARAVKIPVVGMGGISTWEDAAEFLLAGASAVQVGTIIFADPSAPERIVAGLSEWLDREGCTAVSEVIGSVRL